MQTAILNNGVKIPVVGFGVFQIPAPETAAAVANAIEAGYRHIDTAQAYINETEVGEGIKQSGVARKDLFVTTKVWVENMGYEKAKASIERSLSRLGLDYIDMLLIHQPYGDTYGAWRAMEEAYKAGVLKAIGVSNFATDRLVDLGTFNSVMPMVNQIEINPFHQRKAQVDLLKAEGIVPEAWAPFAEGKNNIFNNQTLVSVAHKHRKSVAQVIIRYFIEQGIVVLSKSVKPERMRENLNVFDFHLSADDHKAIAKLDAGKSQFINHFTPDTVRWMKTRIFNV
ncbi:aldo/keto reductase [Capnocytophaga haemolytica]